MTAKELKAILADAPDETVIAIVNYRGWLSRGISLMEDPLRIVNDNGKNVWHLFIYEDNRIEMAYGITPEKEIEDTIRYQAEKPAGFNARPNVKRKSKELSTYSRRYGRDNRRSGERSHKKRISLRIMRV